MGAPPEREASELGKAIDRLKNVLVRRARSMIGQATIENEVEDWNNARSGRPI
jgi:hypothetical protein